MATVQLLNWTWPDIYPASCSQEGISDEFRLRKVFAVIGIANRPWQKFAANVEALIRVCFLFDSFNVAFSFAWSPADRLVWCIYQAFGRTLCQGDLCRPCSFASFRPSSEK